MQQALASAPTPHAAPHSPLPSQLLSSTSLFFRSSASELNSTSDGDDDVEGAASAQAAITNSTKATIASLTQYVSGGQIPGETSTFVSDGVALSAQKEKASSFGGMDIAQKSEDDLGLGLPDDLFGITRKRLPPRSTTTTTNTDNSRHV